MRSAQCRRVEYSMYPNNRPPPLIKRPPLLRTRLDGPHSTQFSRLSSVGQGGATVCRTGGYHPKRIGVSPTAIRMVRLLALGVVGDVPLLSVHRSQLAQERVAHDRAS